MATKTTSQPSYDSTDIKLKLNIRHKSRLAGSNLSFVEKRVVEYYPENMFYALGLMKNLTYHDVVCLLAATYCLSVEALDVVTFLVVDGVSVASVILDKTKRDSYGGNEIQFTRDDYSQLMGAYYAEHERRDNMISEYQALLRDSKDAERYEHHIKSLERMMADVACNEDVKQAYGHDLRSSKAHLMTPKRTERLDYLTNVINDPFW